MLFEPIDYKVITYHGPDKPTVLDRYNRDYWRYIFSQCSREQRKRLKTLIRRRAAIYNAEVERRIPYNPSYWQICTRQISDIVYDALDFWNLIKG